MSSQLIINHSLKKNFFSPKTKKVTEHIKIDNITFFYQKMQ